MSVAQLAAGYEITDGELKTISDQFERSSPEAILSWTLKEFGSNVGLATGFGVEGCVLVHMIADIDCSTRMFYLETDLLFPETYALRDQLEARYGVRFERPGADLSLTDQAAKYGDRLWHHQPDQCCRLRKVEPLRKALSTLRAWITGIRREQSPARARSGIVERDRQFGLIKVNPLAAWSTKDVWDYVVKNQVPYNPLHNSGYPSIGCVPCTTPVKIGEDPRAGRWRGNEKSECGIQG